MSASPRLASLVLIISMCLCVGAVSVPVAESCGVSFSDAALGAAQDAGDGDEQRPEKPALLVPAPNTRTVRDVADSAPRRLPGNRILAVLLSHREAASPASLSPVPLRC